MMVVARVHCELHLCKTMEVVVVMAGATVETFGVLQNASWCVTTQLTLERVALLHHYYDDYYTLVLLESCRAHNTSLCFINEKLARGLNYRSHLSSILIGDSNNFFDYCSCIKSSSSFLVLLRRIFEMHLFHMTYTLCINVVMRWSH